MMIVKLHSVCFIRTDTQWKKDQVIWKLGKIRTSHAITPGQFVKPHSTSIVFTVGEASRSTIEQHVVNEIRRRIVSSKIKSFWENDHIVHIPRQHQGYLGD